MHAYMENCFTGKRTRKQRKSTQIGDTSVPYWISVKTIPKLWQLWNNGCIEKDLLPVKTYVDPSKRKADFDADRFRRWRHLAEYIEHKAQLSNLSTESVVADLQAKMHDMAITIPKFVKEALPALQAEARYRPSIRSLGSHALIQQQSPRILGTVDERRFSLKFCL